MVEQVSGEIAEAIESLARLGKNAGPVAVASLKATPVGRNQVWELRDCTDRCVAYAKRTTSESWYRREILGYQLAEKITLEDTRFHAARLIGVHDQSQMIVTSPIGGRPVSLIFCDAFRKDKNPFRNRKKIDLAVQAIRGVVAYLAKLRTVAVPNQASLYDHSIDGVLVRINKKLKQPMGNSADRTFADWLGIPSADVSVRAGGDFLGETLFGDVSLGNFYLEDGRIGAIDFEDLGSGSLGRDEAYLSLQLQKALRQFHYWGDVAWVDRVLPNLASRRVWNLLTAEQELLGVERIVSESTGHLRSELGERKKIIVECLRAVIDAI